VGDHRHCRIADCRGIRLFGRSSRCRVDRQGAVRYLPLDRYRSVRDGRVRNRSSGVRKLRLERMLNSLRLLKKAASNFVEDDCLSSAAAMAYYAIFSLPPLLVVVFSLATFMGVSQDRINSAALEHLGIPSAAEPTEGSQAEDGDEESSASIQLGSVAERTNSPQFGGIGPVGRVLGVVVLIFASTGLFAQLQFGLNRAWNVKPPSDQSGIKRYLWKRLLSLGMILIVVLLLFGSLIASAVLSRTIEFVRGAAPEEMIRIASFALDQALTFALATLMFATVFKLLPDVSMRWGDVWSGAMFTAVLFVIGKALIAWYMQRANLGASWGSAAGSIIALLAWLYYTSLIILFGAEVTQVWSRGNSERPNAFA
jgi:membrane protein